MFAELCISLFRGKASLEGALCEVNWKAEVG